MPDFSIFNILVVFVLASGVWYFFDAMRARELATSVVMEYCKQSSLQFLDGTVGLKTVALSFEGGRPHLKRRYEFHYSESDHSRNIGLVTINGIEVENFILPNKLYNTEPISESRHGDSSLEA